MKSLQEQLKEKSEQLKEASKTSEALFQLQSDLRNKCESLAIKIIKEENLLSGLDFDLFFNDTIEITCNKKLNKNHPAIDVFVTNEGVDYISVYCNYNNFQIRFRFENGDFSIRFDEVKTFKLFVKEFGVNIVSNNLLDNVKNLREQLENAVNVLEIFNENDVGT